MFTTLITVKNYIIFNRECSASARRFRIRSICDDVSVGLAYAVYAGKFQDLFLKILGYTAYTTKEFTRKK